MQLGLYICPKDKQLLGIFFYIIIILLGGGRRSLIHDLFVSLRPPFRFPFFLFFFSF